MGWVVCFQPQLALPRNQPSQWKLTTMQASNFVVVEQMTKPNPKLTPQKKRLDVDYDGDDADREEEE